MKVLYKAPGGRPEVREVENTLKALQGLVGGYIEAHTLASDCACLCNENGRLLEMPFNCRIAGADFVGPVVLVGVSGEEFTDVPEDAGIYFGFRGRLEDLVEVRE